LKKNSDAALASVFPYQTKSAGTVPAITYTEKSIVRPFAAVAKPRAVICVFPGTNCEYETARRVEEAGGSAEVIVINTLSPALLLQSVQHVAARIQGAQMLLLPGGFSGGDEPEGSAKFIAAFMRNPAIAEQIHGLLARKGLILGICNGFQALIKLGLVPYGKIVPITADCPTLTFNEIGRHQSSYVYTRIASGLSPWLAATVPGEIYTVPISHGEGRFVASDAVLESLIAKGQVATQYCDFAGVPSMDIGFNPNGSALAIEGITSEDGLVFGKMAHSERVTPFTGKNIYGKKDQQLFISGVNYFK